MPKATPPVPGCSAGQREYGNQWRCGLGTSEGVVTWILNIVFSLNLQCSFVVCNICQSEASMIHM